MSQEEPIRILADNLKVDTMLFIGAYQITHILIKGYYLPVLFFRTQRERHVFDVLVNGYMSMCEEIYDAIKENHEHKPV